MRIALVVVGVVLIIFGAVFTFQGLGYLPGSPMTGVRLWAIVGPILALVGIGLAAGGVRRKAK